jgi:hypothetical protein
MFFSKQKDLVTQISEQRTHMKIQNDKFKKEIVAWEVIEKK